MMDKKKLTSQDFYDEKYLSSNWLAQRRKDAQILIKKVAGLNIFKENSKVLDAGCGSGELCQEITKKFGSQTYGMDLNRIALKNAKSLGVDVRFHDLDEKWPFVNSFFDVVCATEIIEHVINPDHFLNEAKRVLKRKGYLVISTPNLAAWFNRFIFLFGYQPFFLEPSTVDKTVGLSFVRKLTPNRKPMGHIRCFTLKALKDLLSLYDYKVIYIKGNSVYYLPFYMKPFDVFFSFIPELATDITVVAQKK